MHEIMKNEIKDEEKRDKLISIFEKEKLINVFKLDSDGGSHDFEIAMLKVFLNGNLIKDSKKILYLFKIFY